MKALRIDRSLARFAAARVGSGVVPGAGARLGPLRLVDDDPPELPGEGWEFLRPRLTGICGSDLATVDGHASRYFEPLVSFPFVPGHEIVADRGLPGEPTPTAGRVVVEPVLGCAVRGIDPPCPACARGDLGDCERVGFGDLAPGLQTGYCADTGGGWSTLMVAHASQLHAVPETWSDEAAVLVEPTACAVHGAFVAADEGAAGGVVAVVGAGALGLTTIAALHRYARPATLLAGAKYPSQRRLATELGADVVVEPSALARAVRRATGSLAYGTQLTGGADVVVDCVGSADSIAASLALVRPRGAVVLVGMPAEVTLGLTTLWQRETRLVGAYAYGTETLPDGSRRRTFDLAFELVGAAGLERLLSATYPLARYRDALAHASTAGRRGAVKIAFDLRQEKERNR